MARVPVITSPCPLRWQSMPVAGQDFCGQCQRRVHNLDSMSDVAREAFFASCDGDVCVAYTVSRPRAVLGAIGLGVAAAAMAGAAMADETKQATFATETTGPTCDPLATIQNIVVGGVKGARSAKLIDKHEVAIPDAPQIAEVDSSEWLPTPQVAAQGNEH